MTAQGVGFDLGPFSPLTYRGEAEALEATLGLAQATGTTTAPLLVLSAWIQPANTDLICAALLVASGTSNYYRDADRGGTDTPLDGELGLGAGQTVISRIRRHAALFLTLNDNNNPVTLNLGAYFSTGDASNATIYIQTVEGVESFAVSSPTLANANTVRFGIPAALDTLLQGIATGDRFILAITTPVVQVTPEPLTAHLALAEATGSTPGVRTFTIDPFADDNAPAILIDPVLVEGGATAYLVALNRAGQSVQFYTAATSDGDGSDTGPQMTAAWEAYAEAITLDNNDTGDSLVLRGPGHPDNTFVDPTEPYFWTPANTVATFWAAAIGASVTVTLDDGVPIVQAFTGNANPLTLEATLAEATGSTLALVFGNARALEATLALAEVSGQTTPPGNTANAEPLDAALRLAEATGQTEAPDFQGDAQPIEWSGSLSQAEGSTVPPDFTGDAQPDRVERIARASHRRGRRFTATL